MTETAELLDAVEGTRERGLLEVDTVLVDFVLAVERVEAVDKTRERPPAEVGVMSDLAVSNAVELSLREDMVDAGRDKPEGGRRVDGPGAVFRIVDACDFADFTEATDERKRAPLSLVDVVEDTCRRVDLVETASSLLTLVDLMEAGPTRVAWPGVNFESGRGFEVLTVLREASVTRETVECVLRATDRTEAAEDLIVSSVALTASRATDSGRTECMLPASSSGFGDFRPPTRLAVALGVAFGGLNKSSTETSISVA